MKYSDDVYKKANNLKIRFSLIKLRDQCYLKVQQYELNVDEISIFDWVGFNRIFNNLLKDYDNGVKLNEDFILSLYGKNISNCNVLTINRLIKLIKIV